MNDYLTEDQKILCDCDRPVLPPCVLTLLFTPEVNGVTFFTPAPELIGNLHSGYSLEILKLFVSLCKSIVGAVLPFSNTDKLCRGFSAGKQVVAACLHCINCRLNFNVITNPSSFSLNVSYYHATTVASHAELN